MQALKPACLSFFGAAAQPFTARKTKKIWQIGKIAVILQSFSGCNHYKIGMKQASEYLEAHGVKPSQQRIVIMDFLIHNRIHPSAEEIHQHLCPAMPTLSLTTVYNTLNLLVARNAVKIVNIEDKVLRYDACTEPHPHFLCTHCGKIFDLPAVAAEQILESLPHDQLLQTFRVDEVQVIIKGLCPACRNELANTDNRY